MPLVEVARARLEVVDIPGDPSRPPLLLLHEGLGSVSMWRDFPARLAGRTGCRTIAYSRAGHGRSSRRPAPPDARFMHEEARETLPALRECLAIARPVLVGHSTGASMALLHAASDPAGVAGVLAMAPLAFVEPSNLESIRKAKAAYASTDWRTRLARHHDDPDRVFRDWCDTWLDSAFASWSLTRDLGELRCPVTAILGRGDEYSTPAQVEAIREAAPACPRFEALHLDDCGHAPHRDRPEAVLQSMEGLLDAL